MERVEVRCSGCARKGFIDPPARTLRCKACGGEVRPVVAAPAPLQRRTTTMRRKSLARAAAAIAPAEGADRTISDTGLLRAEYAEAKKSIVVIRSLFVATAVWHLVLYLFVLSLASSLGVGSHLPAWLHIYHLAGLLLCVAGIVLAPRMPFACAVVLATWMTLEAVVLAVRFGIDAIGIVHVLLAFGLWFSLGRARRLEQLLRQHPELRGGRRPQDARGAAVRERARADARQQKIRLAMIGVPVLALGVGAIWLLTRPPKADAAVATFEAAWARSDVEGVLGMMKGEPGGPRLRRFERLLRVRGWDKTLPMLERGATKGPDDGPVHRTYQTPLGEVAAIFKRGGDKQWFLDEVRLPIVAAPSPDETIAQFTAAWAASNVEGIVALMDPESGDRISTSFRGVVERRGWKGAFPAGATTTTEWRPGATSATSYTEWDDGSFEAIWSWRAPDWVLSGYKAP